MHLIALRPQPGLAATLEKARAAGLAIAGHALSEIRALPWDCPDPAAFDGLLIGSANAILNGGAHLERLKDKPVFAVGEATAEAARAAGLAVAMVGSGGLQGVLDAISGPCHLLRIAGEEHVPLTPPEGVSFDTVIAYRNAMLPLDAAAIVLQSGSALVLLHSAATARHFAAECDRLGLYRARITLAALGPRIAAAAGEGWRAVHTASRPDEVALLALASHLCQKSDAIPAPRAGQP
ncbi:uroporphyrinogen-III synthase [Erythrobacter dokdonensis]|uniref:Uroporphyrinogen-III synthase n=1 Tax=Erythrobacter dokdonensis DSW-74 TaxID=1300349 RepID=A0A1A7BKI3_9SPHN|nr:uroporphyrinogen-III synthase [Erythrobacter dokdonensis]OBV11992.1 Uroporphyrinogen-III synthase [Erythrobacter dokdonensis DSW-74]